MDEQNKSANKRIKLCIVALGAYPLLANMTPRNIIGPDVHQVILAKEFVKKSFDVSIISYCEGGVSIDGINGIDIINIKEPCYKLRILNIASKAVRVWNGMAKANANIYFQAGGIPGIMSIFCKILRKNYIYENASDAIVNKKLVSRKIKEFSHSMFTIASFGYWLDIKLADVVIVQNEYQLMMLKRNFGKDGILIKMAFPLKETNKKTDPPTVLWVGSMAEVKQPELFVELAEAIPEARFQMIGGHSGNQELYDRIKDSAGRISNLEFLGVMPFNEIDEYFDRGSILVNTSIFEGFPNAFIQAWMHCMPVVSLNADPDELLYAKGLGVCSKKFDQLIKDVKTLLKDEILREVMGANGRRYVEREHDIKKIIGKYVGLFIQLYK